jgi:hypothetical protein
LAVWIFITEEKVGKTFKEVKKKKGRLFNLPHFPD